MADEFNDFTLKWGNLDRGLRSAVGRACRSYINTGENFPALILKSKNNVYDKYDHLAKHVDRQIPSSPRLIAGEKNKLNVQTVNNWIKNDDAKLSHPPRLDNERIALKVLFYFKEFHKDYRGQHDNRYYREVVEKYLEAPGKVAERRARFSGKDAPTKEVMHVNAEPEFDTATQLKLSVWLNKISEETRFLYRSRAIPFVANEQAFAQLDRFRTGAGKFRWHLIYGPGGTGKSRLALEYALEIQKSGNSDIGFLSLDDAKRFPWGYWQPSKPTFLIVDYAAREADTVALIMRTVSLRDDIQAKVRLLLLERDLTGVWFDKITHKGQIEHDKIDQAWFAEDGALEPPDDIWPIMEHICSDVPERLPGKEEALCELERIDHHCRPLYAAFLADAYRRGENPRNWDSYALVENVLQHEKRYWDQGRIDHLDVNLCACATTTGGFPAEWVETMSTHEMKGFLPVWRGNQTRDRLASIYGDGIVEDIPPLEPDILGEVFVVDYWKSASRFERQHLIDFASTLVPWFAEFIERMVSDFPGEISFDLLENVVKLDFLDYKNAKPELIFNIVTALAKHHPQYALRCYRLFRHLDVDQGEIYFAECVIDGALNLIVGVDNLPLEQAFEVYGIQKHFASAISPLPEIDGAQCGLALSLIAKYPIENPDQFRMVLADALRLLRRNPDDSDIRHDTCIAISNFVNLLDATHFDHARDLLQTFRREAPKNINDELSEAWIFILYHVFLLFLVQANVEDLATEDSFRLAFENLVNEAPEAVQYQGELLKLYKADIDN